MNENPPLLGDNWYGSDEVALGGTPVQCHCTTKPIWTALGSELGRHGKDPATNRVAITRYTDGYREYGLVVCDAVYQAVR